MGARFLHIDSRYLWCAFILLALIPGIAKAAPKYVKTQTPGVTETFGQFFMRESLNNTFNNNQLTTTSTVNAGKQLSIPSKWTASASAPKYAVKAAKLLGPLGLGLELLQYILENTPALEHPTEDRFVKSVEPDTIQQYSCNYNCWAGAGPFNSIQEMCTASMAARTAAGSGEVFTYTGYRFSGSTVICQNAAIPGYGTENFTGVPIGTPIANPNAGDVIELDPADWHEIEELPTLPQLSDQQLDDLKKTPIGVPVESPEFTSLPETRPMSSPYQKPGPTGSPEQGQWEQVIARLLPGYRDKVVVETRIVPVTGPQGIEDPTSPYDATRPEQDVEWQPNINEDGSLDVRITNTLDIEICKEGDTRLICTELGEPPDDEVPQDEFELSFDHDPVVFVEGSCPTGPTVNTPWGNVTFDMYWPCEFATAIKPIVLAVAMFAAVYIFVGGLRTE